MPDQDTLRESRSLRLLGSIIHDARIWQFNRRTVANAFALGMFAMWVPVPMQMIIVAIFAIPCRANLPLGVALVWITNPVTIPPMFFGAYLFGTWILGSPMVDIEFDLTVEWLLNGLGQIWEPFLLGCLLLGIISSATGYLLIRILWRWHIWQSLRKRAQRRA
ncbi:MAG: DUF2062 domain-containing protein [Pseudomonadota bacterium]